MMKFRHFLFLLAAFICPAAMTSCEHRELTDPTDVHYIRVYLDEQIKNVTYGFYNEEYEHPEFTSPLNMNIALASPHTGEVIFEGLLRTQGKDARGRYIDGYVKARPGTYNLVVYQVGSPVTHIRYPGNYYDIQAYASPVSDRILGYLPETSKVLDSEKIMQEPEHILVSRYDNLVIEHSMAVDTLKTASGDHFTASSIVISYYIQLRVTGLEWVKSAAAVISGMAGSSRLCEENGMIEEDPINLYFSMNQGDRSTAEGTKATTATLYSTFNTFGKIPDLLSELTLSFEFGKSDGSSQVEEFDISEAFKTPLAIENQWILLDKEITITKPVGGGSGGMEPGVEGWEEEDADLYM